jgi:predicted metal-dependent hydrolase
MPVTRDEVYKEYKARQEVSIDELLPDVEELIDAQIRAKYSPNTITRINDKLINRKIAQIAEKLSVKTKVVRDIIAIRYANAGWGSGCKFDQTGLCLPIHEASDSSAE